MNITEEQFDSLLNAAGNRRGQVLKAAQSMGLVELPAPPPPARQPRVRTSTGMLPADPPEYEPGPNAAVEGADADTGDDDAEKERRLRVEAQGQGSEPADAELPGLGAEEVGGGGETGGEEREGSPG